MAHPQRDYRYRLRKYPRRRGIIWRWFIFEGGTSSPVETGIILEPDRDKAEAAAKEAIERLRMNFRSHLLHCRVCKEPLTPTDGEYALKYFLVEATTRNGVDLQMKHRAPQGKGRGGG